jgi:FAD/FMN-containing dehydrogenase
MVKKAHIVVCLVPEASEVADETLKAEIQREIAKATYVIPWADQLESIEIQEANQPKENEDYEGLARLRRLSETLDPKNLFRKPEDTK